MKRKAILLVAGLLAVGLIAAGCGDDDDESSDTGTDTVATALTKEEFLAQGNAICKQGSDEIDAAANQVFESGKKPTPQELETFTNDTLVPGVQKQIDEIRALGAPEGDEDQVNSMLDAADEALAEIEADPQGSFEGEDDPFADVNKDLAAYGLTTCAEG